MVAPRNYGPGDPQYDALTNAEKNAYKDVNDVSISDRYLDTKYQGTLQKNVSLSYGPTNEAYPVQHTYQTPQELRLQGSNPTGIPPVPISAYKMDYLNRNMSYLAPTNSTMYVSPNQQTSDLYTSKRLEYDRGVAGVTSVLTAEKLNSMGIGVDQYLGSAITRDKVYQQLSDKPMVKPTVYDSGFLQASKYGDYTKLEVNPYTGLLSPTKNFITSPNLNVKPDYKPLGSLNSMGITLSNDNSGASYVGDDGNIYKMGSVITPAYQPAYTGDDGNMYGGMSPNVSISRSEVSPMVKNSFSLDSIFGSAKNSLSGAASGITSYFSPKTPAVTPSANDPSKITWNIYNYDEGLSNQQAISELQKSGMSKNVQYNVISPSDTSKYKITNTSLLGKDVSAMMPTEQNSVLLVNATNKNVPMANSILGYAQQGGKSAVVIHSSGETPGMFGTSLVHETSHAVGIPGVDDIYGVNRNVATNAVNKQPTSAMKTMSQILGTIGVPTEQSYVSYHNELADQNPNAWLVGTPQTPTGGSTVKTFSPVTVKNKYPVNDTFTANNPATTKIEPSPNIFDWLTSWARPQNEQQNTGFNNYQFKNGQYLLKTTRKQKQNKSQKMYKATKPEKQVVQINHRKSTIKQPKLTAPPKVVYRPLKPIASKAKVNTKIMGGMIQGFGQQKPMMPKKVAIPPKVPKSMVKTPKVPRIKQKSKNVMNYFY